jgi:hypothetical protein
LHDDFLSQKKPTIVQVLDGQLKADGWGDRITGLNVGLPATSDRSEPVGCPAQSAAHIPWG